MTVQAGRHATSPYLLARQAPYGVLGDLGSYLHERKAFPNVNPSDIGTLEVSRPQHRAQDFARAEVVAAARRHE